jgi:hypothetical protein
VDTNSYVTAANRVDWVSRMRIWLIGTMIAGAATVLAAMLGCYLQLVHFGKRYPTLSSDADILAFKRLATIQMYISLPGLYLAWLPLVLWLPGKFFLGQLTWLDGMLFVTVPFLAQLGLAAATVGTAKAVRRTPAANDVLAAERDRVADIWVHKNFPEW